MVALPLTLKLALAGLCTLLGHLVAGRLHRTHRADLDSALRHAPWLSLLALVTALVGGAAWLLTLRPDFTWALPLWLQYWAPALNWTAILTALSFLFATTLSLAARTSDVRGWPLLVIAIAALGGTEWLQARLLTAPVLSVKQTSDGVVLQTSGRSCGAAAGANVARWFGIQATEREMALRFGTTLGTSAAQIVYGMRELGIEGTQVTIDPHALAGLEPPAMLLLEPRSALTPGHIVAYTGQQNGRPVVLDSLSGRTTWAADRVPDTWRGRAIVFRRTP
jgi:hypothetical protein